MTDSGFLIRGTVQDQAGIPIDNARVWISSGPVAIADVAILTDSTGAFLISIPAIGRYEIACAADDHQTTQQVLEVFDKNTAIIEIHLRESA